MNIYDKISQDLPVDQALQKVNFVIWSWACDADSWSNFLAVGASNKHKTYPMSWTIFSKVLCLLKKFQHF